MLVTLLVVLLSGPSEPPILGVMGRFKSINECLVASNDLPPEMRAKVMCLEIQRAARQEI